MFFKKSLLSICIFSVELQNNVQVIREDLKCYFTFIEGKTDLAI